MVRSLFLFISSIFFCISTAHAAMPRAAVLLADVSALRGERDSVRYTPNGLRDKLVETIQKEGTYEIVPLDQVDEAVQAISGRSTCPDNLCLEKVVDRLGADVAIMAISTSHSEDGRDVLEIWTSRGTGDGGTELEKATRALVSQALNNEKNMILISSVEREREEPQQDSPKPNIDEDIYAEDDVQNDLNIKETTNKGMNPTAFWISAGITGALAVALVSTEIAALRKRDKIELGPTSQSYKESFNNVQLAGRAFFVATAVSLATSTVLFFLTDFEGTNEKKEDAHLSFAPFWNGKSIGAGLGGKF